jgi:hypothetical protein
MNVIYQTHNSSSVSAQLDGTSSFFFSCEKKEAKKNQKTGKQ